MENTLLTLWLLSHVMMDTFNWAQDQVLVRPQEAGTRQPQHAMVVLRNDMELILLLQPLQYCKSYI